MEGHGTCYRQKKVMALMIENFEANVWANIGPLTLVVKYNERFFSLILKSVSGIIDLNRNPSTVFHTKQCTRNSNVNVAYCRI